MHTGNSFQTAHQTGHICMAVRLWREAGRITLRPRDPGLSKERRPDKVEGMVSSEINNKHSSVPHRALLPISPSPAPSPSTLPSPSSQPPRERNRPACLTGHGYFVTLSFLSVGCYGQCGKCRRTVPNKTDPCSQRDGWLMG